MEEQHAFLGPLIFHLGHRCWIVWLHRHRWSLVCDSEGSLLRLLAPVPVQSSEWADTAVPPGLKVHGVDPQEHWVRTLGNKVGNSLGVPAR